MVTAGKFRHNTAIGAVHVDLRMDAMGKQPLLRIDEAVPVSSQEDSIPRISMTLILVKSW
mgnify:CR=1 FL=1